MSITSNSVTVREGTAEDASVLVPLLASVFFSDPVAEWVFPDPRLRRQILPGFFHAFYRQALTCGTVYTTDDLDGALLSASSDVDDPTLDERLAEAVGPYARRLADLIALLQSAHPAEPHRHATFAGVAPHRQRTGLAATLVGAMLRDCEALGQPVYAETSSPGGQATVRRHGFVPIAAEIRLPDGPSLQPVWWVPNVRGH